MTSKLYSPLVRVPKILCHFPANIPERHISAFLNTALSVLCSIFTLVCSVFKLQMKKYTRNFPI